MTGHFYLHLSSEDSSSTSYAEHKFTDFTTSLPKELYFKQQNSWTAALVDISLSNYTSNNTGSARPIIIKDLPQGVTVLCDVVANSYFKSGLYPVLRIIGRETSVAGSMQQTFYIPLNTSKISRVRIYLKDEDLRDLDISKWLDDTSIHNDGERIELRCTLHFTTDH